MAIKIPTPDEINKFVNDKLAINTAPTQSPAPNISPSPTPPPSPSYNIPAPQPTVAPGPGTDQGSLEGTMTTPPPVGITPEIPAPKAPTTPSTTAAPTPGSTKGFSDYISILQDKLKGQNVLADARAKLVTALYDRPLSPEELASLPANVKTAVEKAQQTGDKRDIELQIRLLNDQIKGRNNTLDQGVNFLVNEHKAELDRIDNQRQDAINNVLNFVDRYGSNASSALKSLYGDDYISKLKDYGIDIDNLATIKTLDQIAKEGITPSGSGVVSIPQNIGNQQNQLAYRNNNPGNLRYVGQEGASMGAGGFAKFDSPEAGFQALIDDLNYKKSGKSTNVIPNGPNKGKRLTGDTSLIDMIRIYAPTADQNNPESYANTIANNLGIDVNTKIKDISTQDLAEQIAKHESGTTITPVQSDVSLIADAIQNGTQPPVLTGLYKNTTAVKAELSKRGFDLAKALQSWNAAQAFSKNLNSSQMIRFRGLADSVVNTIDEVKDLAGQMKQGGIPIVNKAKLEYLVQTKGNSPEGQLASRYLAAVNTLKEEFANLANGGYAPTEAAWSLANSQINGNYGIDQLNASLDEVQRLINYRVQGITGQQPLVPGGTTDYTSELDKLMGGK